MKKSDDPPVDSKDSDIFYIHDVSPIKKARNSGTQYFNCLLQGDQSAKKAVCFSPKKHKFLHDAAESQSPVKISKMMVSKNDDVIIGDRTSVTLSKASFGHDERFQKDAIVSLNDMHSLAGGQILSCKCYIAKVNDVTNHKLRTGEEIEKQEIVISDATSAIKLILYGENVNTLTEGKSYLLKNLRLHTFKDTIFLNTAQSVEFVADEIEFVPHIDDYGADTEVSISCKIIGVSSILLSFHCTSCERKVSESDQDLLKCQLCDTQMLKSKCRVTMGVSVVVCDILKKVNLTLFFPNNQAYQLKSIVNFPSMDDNYIAKALLEFDDVLFVTFDVTSKTVLHVNKDDKA